MSSGTSAGSIEELGRIRNPCKKRLAWLGYDLLRTEEGPTAQRSEGQQRWGSPKRRPEKRARLRRARRTAREELRCRGGDKRQAGSLLSADPRRRAALDALSLSTKTMCVPPKRPEDVAVAPPPAAASPKKGDEDLWVVHGRRYDLRNFRARHPGGATALDLCRGSDATRLFEQFHVMTEAHRKELKKYARRAGTHRRRGCHVEMGLSDASRRRRGRPRVWRRPARASGTRWSASRQRPGARPSSTTTYVPCCATISKPTPRTATRRRLAIARSSRRSSPPTPQGGSAGGAATGFSGWSCCRSGAAREVPTSRAEIPRRRGRDDAAATTWRFRGVATTPRRRRGDSVGSRRRRGEDSVETGSAAATTRSFRRVRVAATPRLRRGDSVETGSAAVTWSFRRVRGDGYDVELPWSRGSDVAIVSRPGRPRLRRGYSVETRRRRGSGRGDFRRETRAQVLRVAHHGQPLARREPPRGLANPLGQRGRAGRVGAVALLLRVLVTFAARDPFPKIPSGETSRDDDDDDDDDDDADRQRSHASGTSSTARRTT